MHIIEKVSAGGLVLRGNEVLTLYIANHEEIVFPKGTIENNESPVEAAIREVREETGYQAEIIAPIDSIAYEFDEQQQHFRKTVHFYLMRLIDENDIPEPQLESHEIFETRWLKIQDAIDILTHDVNKALLKKALEIKASSKE